MVWSAAIYSNRCRKETENNTKDFLLNKSPFSLHGSTMLISESAEFSRAGLDDTILKNLPDEHLNRWMKSLADRNHLLDLTKNGINHCKIA